MRIYKAKDYEEMSRKAAGIVSAQIIMKPDCVLGLATGSTPVGLYKQLIEWYRNGDLDFSGVRTVNLDEYKGISRENDQSYYYFMHQNLFDHVNIPAEKVLPQLSVSSCFWISQFCFKQPLIAPSIHCSLYHF